MVFARSAAWWGGSPRVVTVGGFYPLGIQVPPEFFYWDATGLAIFPRRSPFFFFSFYSPQVLLLVLMF